jgi:hypothetical protein
VVQRVHIPAVKAVQAALMQVTGTAGLTAVVVVVLNPIALLETAALARFVLFGLVLLVHFHQLV